ncbi:MAG: dodecin family protein [Alphaproteobacteria bacterium]
MTVARTTEISSTSTKGFEDAINEGLTRAAKTVRNMKGAWVKEQEVVIDNDRVSEYKVHMLVTFVLDN